MTHKLIAIADVGKLDGWPYSPWQTARLIREGKLGAVRVGKRRVFTTEALIQEFIERHTTTPGKAGKAVAK